MFENNEAGPLLAKRGTAETTAVPAMQAGEDGDGGGRPHVPDAGAGHTGSGAPADMIA